MLEREGENDMPEILYTNIRPLPFVDNQQTFSNKFLSLVSQSDAIDIAVGYVSRSALEELDRIVEQSNVEHISLMIGMYYIEGMPESIYRTAMKINDKWLQEGRGSIRLIKTMKYHGKNYCFYHDSTPFKAIVGSANLGALIQDANNRRQYELSVLLDSPQEVNELAIHIELLKSDSFSVNIASVHGLKLIHEQNMSLTGIESVYTVPQTDLSAYEMALTDVSFSLPLKVPAYGERFMDDGKHFTKSNINVCYAAPRSSRKARDWYEIQMTVSREITCQPGYPEKNKDFMVVTDDGYRFMAHTTSDGNKQFNAVGDELIIGRWLKGRLVAAGLVNPINDIRADTERRGIITKEMLDEYGCDHLILRKTSKIMIENGNEYEIWMLSMVAADIDG